MTQEKTITAFNGYIMLFAFLILFIGSIVAVLDTGNPLWGIAFFIAILILPGLILVNPNESRVLLLFGDYKGNG